MGQTIAEALIQEGREIEVIQTRQEVLTNLLKTKFGQLPPHIVDRILTINEISQLDMLLNRLLTVNSLEEMAIE